MKKDDFIGFLKSQLDDAKKFTEEFINRVKRDVELYEGRHVRTPAQIAEAGGDIVSIYNQSVETRYNVVDRMIFTNTEGAKASLFDRLPDLVFKSRNKDGDIKKQIIMGVYEYLKDKLDLYGFAMTAAHWFILSGMTMAYIDYLVETYDAQAYDDDGYPVYDELGNPVTYKKYKYDDPTINVFDPEKTYFAPGSKYSIDTMGVPYVVREELMNIDEIRATYGEKVKADSSEVTDGKKNMTKVYFLYGRIPEKFKHFVKDWDFEAEYYVVFTNEKVLFSKRRKRRQLKMARWYGQPNKFFGFGFGKIGEPYQLQKEQRKGQLSRAADVNAYPKLAIKNDGKEKTNPELWKDPRENLVITYNENAPQYITPPGISDNVMKDLNQIESDSQAAFGMIDLSTGAQQTTVDTATGQTIFAEAGQKKIRYAKRIFMEFYRQVVIELFKQCQENWTDPKPITIVDDDGNTQEIEVTKEELADIDFDKDLNIDAESVSVNKDVVREQMIALYDKVKDDPIVDRRKVFIDMLRRGFGVSNPDRYIKESSGVEPGTPLINPQTGEQFVVGKSGEVISQQAQGEMAQPTGQRTKQSQGAVINGVGI